MNTLNDLQDSLDRHAGRAPDGFGLVEQAQAGASRIRRRRRIVRGAVAAAAVLLVAGGVPALVQLRHRSALPGTPPYHRTASQVTVAAAPGSNITIVDVQSGYSTQSAVVVVAGRPGETGRRQVTVHDPGSFDPTRLRRGEKGTVGGLTTWFHTDYRPADDLDIADTVLGWQDPSGAWVLAYPGFGSHRPGSVTVDRQTRDDLTAIAHGLRIGPARDVPMPYRLTWLPSHLRLNSVITRPMTVDAQTHVTLSSDREPGATARPGGRPQARVAVMIDTRPTASRDWPGNRDAADGRPVTVADHAAWYHEGGGRLPNSALAVEIGRCGFIISVERSVITFAELERLVGGIEAVDCGDPGTWGPLR